MKPMYEKVLTTPESSWRFWLYEIEELEFNWHYHPEYEIALTLNSHGERYVGDNIEFYSEFDMALLGPHLPHTWHSSPSIKGQSQQVYVAQIPVAWLESLILGMPDLAPYKNLLQLAKRGVSFSEETVKPCADLFKKMIDSTPAKRFIYLLQIFELMASDPSPAILSSSGYSLTMESDSSADKLDKIIRYIHQNYTKDLRADDVAELVHMSTNYFHRYLKKRAEQTFTELVNQLRISKACSLLINSSKPISTISDSCGFNNLSNFNRRFFQFKHMTPSEFRKTFKGRNLWLNEY